MIKTEDKSKKMIPFLKIKKIMNKNRKASAFCFHKFSTKIGVSNESEERL